MPETPVIAPGSPGSLPPTTTGPTPAPPGTTPMPPDTAPAWWGDVGAALQRLLDEFGHDPVGTELAIRALKAIFTKR